MIFLTRLVAVLLTWNAANCFVPILPRQSAAIIGSSFFAYDSDGAPSDYDSFDLAPETQQVVVDENEDDILIRDTLKRELLLLASVTNRGEYASRDERDIAVDLVNQLEGLNPTADPASHCEGEWDLCLSSTQFFRSSPFFQAIRVAVGDENKAIAENGFDLHDRATSSSRIGRVRQTISEDKLVSEVDLEVGIIPGIPFRVKGTVVTDATLTVVSAEKWEVRVQNTSVKGSNIPIVNQFMDDLRFELPVGDFYNTVQGNVPVVPMKVSISVCQTFTIEKCFGILTLQKYSCLSAGTCRPFMSMKESE
jgi:hypothetical protein